MQVRFKNPEVERFIESKVNSGQFPDRQAVVEDAISRMMDEEIALTPDDLAQIEQGDQEINQGDFVEYADFAAEMRKKFGIKNRLSRAAASLQ